MTTQENKKYTITKETLMPLGMVIALCGGVVWISTQLTNINYKLDMLEEKLEDNWTRRDMENWGLKLKLENPDVNIPVLDS
tara:strand:- start:372 stop:614 length:243 start_codon:yes stop_codon:yes gene_type:complete